MHAAGYRTDLVGDGEAIASTHCRAPVRFLCILKAAVLDWHSLGGRFPLPGPEIRSAQVLLLASDFS